MAVVVAVVAGLVAAVSVSQMLSARPFCKSDKSVVSETKISSNWYERYDCKVVSYKLCSCLPCR